MKQFIIIVTLFSCISLCAIPQDSIFNGEARQKTVQDFLNKQNERRLARLEMEAARGARLWRHNLYKTTGFTALYKMWMLQVLINSFTKEALFRTPAVTSLFAVQLLTVCSKIIAYSNDTREPDEGNIRKGIYGLSACAECAAVIWMIPAILDGDVWAGVGAATFGAECLADCLACYYA